MKLRPSLFQQHRRASLLALLVVFLVYCAYSAGTCFSGQIRKGGQLLGTIFVADTPNPSTRGERDAVPQLSASTQRTRTCASEWSERGVRRGARSRAEPGNRRLPRALIIGVKKSGTRALLEFVRLHPDVRASGCEVHFFDRHYGKGLRWYRRRMPAASDGQTTMEKTPSYFITREVPKRVYNMNPKTKLLLVVRDPVTRATSDYTQAISKLMTTRRFEDLAFVNGTSGEWGRDLLEQGRINLQFR